MGKQFHTPWRAYTRSRHGWDLRWMEWLIRKVLKLILKQTFSMPVQPLKCCCARPITPQSRSCYRSSILNLFLLNLVSCGKEIIFFMVWIRQTICNAWHLVLSIKKWIKNCLNSFVNSTPNPVIPDVCLLREIVNWKIILIHEESLLKFIVFFISLH